MHRAVHTAPECPAATRGHAAVPPATGEAGPPLGLRQAGPSGKSQREAQASAAPGGESAAYCLDAPRDTGASRFDVAPVSFAELDAERGWSGNGLLEPDDEYAAQEKPIGRARGAGRRRRVRAGHYPVGFSPYLMSANKRGSVIPLGRVVIKEDLKVCTGVRVWDVFCAFVRTRHARMFRNQAKSDVCARRNYPCRMPSQT